jgi:hypothetical protein
VESGGLGFKAQDGNVRGLVRLCGLAVCSWPDDVGAVKVGEELGEFAAGGLAMVIKKNPLEESAVEGTSGFVVGTHVERLGVPKQVQAAGQHSDTDCQLGSCLGQTALKRTSFSLQLAKPLLDLVLRQRVSEG